MVISGSFLNGANRADVGLGQRQIGGQRALPQRRDRIVVVSAPNNRHPQVYQPAQEASTIAVVAMSCISCSDAL